MADFALIDKDNLVIATTSVSDVVADTEENGVKFLFETMEIKTVYPQCVFIKETKTDGFRSVFAGIGYEWHEELNAFVSPKKFNSWTLNIETKKYEAPVKKPVQAGKIFVWDENILNWKELLINK